MIWAAISALTGEGMDSLRDRLRTAILSQPGLETLRFPAEGGEELQRALRDEDVVARRFTAEGIDLVRRRSGGGAVLLTGVCRRGCAPLVELQRGCET